MRGNPGTAVRLTIVRAGRERPFDVNITRAIIDIPAVRSEVRDRVGILTVTTFNRNTTEMAQRAMADIERQLGGPPLGYVIDMRSNPGGLLDQAVGLSDLFLERGEIVSHAPAADRHRALLCAAGRRLARRAARRAVDAGTPRRRRSSPRRCRTIAARSSWASAASARARSRP